MITRPSSNAAASRPVLRTVGAHPRYVVRQEYFGGLLYDRAGVGSAGYLRPEQYAWLAVRAEGGEPPAVGEEFEREVRELGLLTAAGAIDYELWPAAGQLPSGMLRSPVRLYYELTRSCNLKCTYCFNESGPGRQFPDELRTEEAVRIIDNLRRDHVPELRLTGGEAVTRPDACDLIARARAIGLAVSLNSNGVYGEELAERVVRAGPNLIIVSLDGIDEEVHADLRGKNQAAVLRTLELYRRAGLKVRVNISLNRRTIEGDLIERSVRYLADRGLEVCLILLRPSGRATAEMVRESFLLADELHRFVGRVQTLREELPGVRIQTSFDIISPRAVKPAPDLDLNTCAAGIAGCNINSRGEFASCAFLAEMDAAFNWGTIRETGYSVLPFWRGDPRLKLFRERSVAKAKGCLSCEYYLTRCQGTCVVQEYWRGLAPGRFDPYCLKEVEAYFQGGELPLAVGVMGPEGEPGRSGEGKLPPRGTSGQRYSLPVLREDRQEGE
jgi:radical SAM protein with 4Fe4S-binding SPASM domain